MVVRIERGQLAYFRKLARENPNEIHAFLIGHKRNRNLVHVYYLEYPELEVSTPCEVRPSLESSLEIERDVEEDGFSVVGTIHSHPGGPPYMSKCDLKTHKEEGDEISGICEVRNGRTHVTFWVLNQPIPCTLEYFED